MNILDLHCDLPSALIQEGRDHLGPRSSGHIDLQRAATGGLRGLFAVAFVHDKETAPRACALAQLRLSEALARRHEGDVVRARCAADLDRAWDEGKLALFSGIENGKALEGSIAALEEMYGLGARYLGVVWNGDNELGRGCANARGGLTEFGRAAVRRACELGMLIDTAHLNPDGFWEVAEMGLGPLFNSHSNARAQRDHKRNLDDAQLRALGQSGGVLGLNFYPPFLVEHGPARLEDLLRHLEHVLDVAGPEAVALGSDFDGIDRSLEEIPDCAAYPRLFDFLRARGYSEELLTALAHGNALRVVRAALDRALTVPEHSSSHY